jgi:uncharacterized protein (TIGR02466 family)
MLAPDPLHRLWHTPMGVFRLENAQEVNTVLVRVFSAMRAADTGQSSGPQAFYASSDDLLQRIRLDEWDQLVQFIVESVRQTVVLANQGAWHEAKPGFQMALRGIWFQMSSAGSHHDVHTHGNCSWSGVYCLQVDPPEQRVAHPLLGEANGVTRFYGPHFNRLGGAAMDFGNAYLQNAHLDIAPVPGQLIVFPSWLAHQALPYHGDSQRVIVSFNMSVHAAQGGDQIHHYAPV